MYQYFSIPMHSVICMMTNMQIRYDEPFSINFCSHSNQHYLDMKNKSDSLLHNSFYNLCLQPRTYSTARVECNAFLIAQVLSPSMCCESVWIL